MTTTEYGVYQNNGATDGTAIITEAIDDALRDDEKAMRIAQLFDRALDGQGLDSGKTWRVQATALEA